MSVYKSPAGLNLSDSSTVISVGGAIIVDFNLLVDIVSFFATDFSASFVSTDSTSVVSFVSASEISLKSSVTVFSIIFEISVASVANSSEETVSIASSVSDISTSMSVSLVLEISIELSFSSRAFFSLCFFIRRIMPPVSQAIAPTIHFPTMKLYLKKPICNNYRH